MSCPLCPEQARVCSSMLFSGVRLRYRRLQRRRSLKKRMHVKILERLQASEWHVLLCKLDLNDNQMINLVCKEMRKPLARDWRVLDLSENHLTSTCLSHLAKVLVDEDRCPQLRSLSLASNNITGDGFVHVARIVRHHPNLQYLNLSHGSSSLGGWKALARAIRGSKQLRVLSLSSCDIQLEDFEELGKSLQFATNLCYLHLDGNSLGNQGLDVLNRMFKQREKEPHPLQYLNLSNNLITDGPELTRFLSLLQEKLYISELNLSHTRLSNPGHNELLVALPKTCVRWIQLSGLPLVSTENHVIGKLWTHFYRSKEFHVALLLLAQTRRIKSVSHAKSQSRRKGTSVWLSPDIIRALIETLLRGRF